jgi:hypothetical protein
VEQSVRTGTTAPLTFAVIDFETADRDPDSACAVAAVRVVGTRIVFLFWPETTSDRTEREAVHRPVAAWTARKLDTLAL